MSIVGLILGRRLANRESEERKIGAFEGIPAMGLDGLGSSAYGPEAALSVLLPLGAASLGYVGWVMAPILALLAILFASYWQTIRAYPNNGGAYVVAKDNLGRNASLLAAAALMTDYVLNVAVGISAGVGALVSAVPPLHPYILPLCLGILVLVTIVNLRGTLDAGRLFALPTYLFVLSFGAILVVGVYKAIASGGHPDPVIAPPELPQATQAATIWLLLRAFASGCTAMTGVEAVSNGMSAFRQPAEQNGHRTLAGIVAILGLLLAGIAYLATAYRVGAMDQTADSYRSVLSQLASAVVGDGILYYVAIASLLCVLALSANTSFVGFPRLCRIVADDDFLPESFAVAGRRLVFTIGILYLAITAGLLLTVFGGITDRLIPLFAVGAFLTFTISQTGMAVHWHRLLKEAEGGGDGKHRLHFWINTVGATTTGVALAIIIAAKFVEGAWITVIVIPGVVAVLMLLHRYYESMARSVSDAGPLDVETEKPVVLVAVQEWNKLADRAIGFALTLSPDVIGVHLAKLAGPDAEEHDKALRQRWCEDVEAPSRAAGLPPPRLMILRAEYRRMHEPVLTLVKELQASSGRRRVAVLVPEFVNTRWYQRLLHINRARRLRSELLKDGNDRLVVITVPWHRPA